MRENSRGMRESDIVYFHVSARNRPSDVGTCNAIRMKRTGSGNNSSDARNLLQHPFSAAFALFAIGYG